MDTEEMARHLDEMDRHYRALAPHGPTPLGEIAAARLRALSEQNRVYRDSLSKLVRWSECFVKDTGISAETLWRQFPLAIEEARRALEEAG